MTDPNPSFSPIAQATAVLSRPNIIWMDKTYRLLMFTLPLCLWELDLDSRARKKDPCPWDEMLWETSEHFRQRTRDEWEWSQQDLRFYWSTWWSPSHGEEAESQMSRLMRLWHLLWHLSPSVNSIFKLACAAIHCGYTSDVWSDPSSTSILCVCEQRRLWRDCAYAQSRLSHRCSPMR